MRKIQLTLSERDAVRIHRAASVGGLQIVVGPGRRSNPPRGMSITRVRYDDEEFSDLTDGAVALFDTRDIRLHSNYDEFLVATVSEGGTPSVIGAAALSVSDWDESVEFSVAVSPQYERQGVARELVQAAIEVAKEYAVNYEWDAPVIEAYVVNDVAMPSLLRALRFRQGTELRRWERPLR